MILAGFARVDVTPPLGTELAGYFEKRLAKDVRDPVELNALAFGNGEDTALLIACDFTGMNYKCGKELRERISRRTGVDAAHIMLSTLHQHTSFRVGDFMNAVPAMGDIAFLDVLYRKFEDVAQMAVADMSESSLGVAKKDALTSLSFTRRYVMADGSVMTNPDTKKYGTPVRRCDASDNAVRLLRFKRDGKKDIALVSFSTHADVIGGKKISADWPGFVRRFVEADAPDTHCVCIVGCQGDSNHVDFLKPSSAERFPEGICYAHSRYMGRVIADTVREMWENTDTHEGDQIFGGIKLVYNKTNTAGMEHFDECRALYDSYERGEIPVCPNHPYTRRVAHLPTAPLYQTVPVTVLGLGDIAFVGFGGEPFTDYTRKTEALATDKTVFCVCMANGNEGYLVTDEAFAEGGYEVTNTNFTAGVQAQCLDAAAALLKQF